MSNDLYYHTIERSSTAEYKDRGSRFIAYAFAMQTLEEFKQQHTALKKEHSKAAHHCFAYRLGLDGNTFRVSDDGEPAGSAGKPILGQLDSKGIVNAGIVVVRYFGGTLLGVPGLINAYRSSAALALQLTPLVQKQVTLPYRLTFNYTRMNEVMMIMRQFGCSILSNEALLFCELKVQIPKARVNEVLFKLKELQDIEATSL